MRRTSRLSVTAAVLTFVAAGLSASPADAAEAPYYWQQRAVKYAPMLVMHRAESYRPSSVQWALDRSVLKFSIDNAGDRTVATRPSATRIGDSAGTSTYKVIHEGRQYLASDCTRPRHSAANCPRTGLAGNEGFYLDLDDSTTRNGPPNTSTTPGRFGGPEIYYQYGPVNGGGWFITYWFFYPYNRWVYSRTQVQAHEGDWERMVIRFDASYRPTQVAYYHHNCHDTYAWSSVSKASTTHPVAYVAKSSHGIWRGEGGQCSSWIPDDETDAGGLLWPTWTTGVAWVRSRGFYGFGGAWGAVGQVSDTTGPLGPSRYKNYSPF